MLKLSSPLAVATVLANLAAGIRSAKPLASATVTIGGSTVTVDGSRASQFPLSKVSAANVPAILALLGCEAPADINPLSVGADYREAMAKLHNATEALKHRDGQLKEANEAVALLDKSNEGAADTIRSLQDQITVLRSRLAEAVATLGKVRDGKVTLAPSAPTGSDLLASIADATMAPAWHGLTMPDRSPVPASALPDFSVKLAPLPVPMLPIVNAGGDPITVRFLPGTQTSSLRECGESVETLKAAGFRFKWDGKRNGHAVSDRNVVQGGCWEARATDVSRAMAAKLCGVMA